MTEEEWLGSTDPTAMLEHLRRKASDRKFRLFALGCCQRVWHLLDGETWRKAMGLALRLPDGGVSDQEYDAVFSEACNVYEDHGIDPFYEAYSEVDSQHPTASEQANAALATLCAIGRFDVDDGTSHAGNANPAYSASTAARAAARAVAYAAARVAATPAQTWEEVRHQESIIQADLLRCVFGNPFRPPPAIDPAWLTWNNGTVKHLAEDAYEQRALPAGTLDPRRLAVLADGLEDAGCGDDALLEHLRGEGPHWRGCWALDLLLRPLYHEHGEPHTLGSQ